MALSEARLADTACGLREEGAAVEIVGGGSLLSRLPEPASYVCLDVGDYSGISAHDPADLTVTVKAGTPMDELARQLAEAGQECPIEGPGSTVGGRVVSGLSGVRRLGVGPVREWLLGGRLITAEGVVVRFGGRTVKNVTGYDLPRLVCGSWGTLGVLTEVTLRVRPLPLFQAWYHTEDAAADLAMLYRPAALVRTRGGVSVLLEGHPEDCAGQARRHDLRQGKAPRLPDGIRWAVPPERIAEALGEIEGEYAAELGVGIIHADPPPGTLPHLRRMSGMLGGRLLVWSAAHGSAAVLGTPAELDRRVKQAFDPNTLFAPWRFAA